METHPTYRVRVTKDHLVFSAAHFITIGDWCERLHGHNWRVAVEVTGELDEDEIVVDFIALRDQLQTIVSELDHSLLVPLQHPTIQVEVSDQEVQLRYQKRRWIIPRDECRLLPIRQTTAESLARWIGEQLLLRAVTAFRRAMSLQIDVEENFGQWATCVLPLMPETSTVENC